MRWFRTFTLSLLVLFLLLLAAPAYRWFQTRKSFVPAGPPDADLVFAAAAAPKWTILPRIVPGGAFDRGGPIGEYLALRQLMAQMESFRIDGTNLYDLRPYLSEAGMTFSPGSVATWDPKSETALLKLPAGDLEEARILVGTEFDEWDSRQMEIRATVVAVDRKNAASFLSADQNLTLDWLAGLPPESVRILNSISSSARSGQRSRNIFGDDNRGIPNSSNSFVDFEFDSVLGQDGRTLSINFVYEYQLKDPKRSGKPPVFKVNTQVTVYTGHAVVLEVGAASDRDRETLTAYYLVLEADRVSMLGSRLKGADAEPD